MPSGNGAHWSAGLRGDSRALSNRHDYLRVQSGQRLGFVGRTERHLYGASGGVLHHHVAGRFPGSAMAARASPILGDRLKFDAGPRSKLDQTSLKADAYVKRPPSSGE